MESGNVERMTWTSSCERVRIVATYVQRIYIILLRAKKRGKGKQSPPTRSMIHSRGSPGLRRANEPASCPPTWQNGKQSPSLTHRYPDEEFNI